MGSSRWLETRETFSSSRTVNLTRILQPTYSKHMTIRANTWYFCKTVLGNFALWSGPTIPRHWTDGQRTFQEEEPQGSNFGFGAGIRLYTHYLNTSIVVAFVWSRNLRRDLSLHWKLSLPRTVPREADIHDFVRNGKLDLVRSIFVTGKATPSDIMPDGTGLLHVCILFPKIAFPKARLELFIIANLFRSLSRVALFQWLNY